MKRKTSTLPSRVYKYALLPPIEQSEEVENAFLKADDHYNKLIAIELDRRVKYRAERSKMFPALAALEVEKKVLDDRLEAQRDAIQAMKATTRSRAVDEVLAADVAQTKTLLKDMTSRLRVERDKCESSESLRLTALLQEAKKAKTDETTMKTLRLQLKKARDMTLIGQMSNRIHEEANDKIKLLRPTTYSGTYLLVEAAAATASMSMSDPQFNDVPTYLLSNRIGVHMCGGMGMKKLVSSTLMRIDRMPIWHVRPSGKQVARGKAARTMLWFRIGTLEGRQPMWARFPMIMDRPLPTDVRIKDAYITRRPCSARIPWRYSLCIVCESREFEKTVSSPEQKGVTSINFGWRQLETGEMRVAQVNSEAQGLSEIRLPCQILSGFAKCRELQKLLDTKFDVIRDTLVKWITKHPALPPAFLEEFRGLAQWKSQHRLADLIWYWTSHRIDDDGDVFPLMTEWLVGYRHIGDWIVYQRRKLLNWRNDFYGCIAKKIVTTSAKLVIDTFKIADVAKRAAPEVQEKGGELARRNRQIAAPGELRLAILHAASKYHCEVVTATAKDGTRRCNVCGEVHPEGITELNHTCIGCEKQWDIDINNTINLQDSNASGEVVPFVRPSKVTKTGDIVSSERANFEDARKELRKLAKTQ